MDSLTNYIFKNTSWLCIGLLIYYFLSAGKVYFLAYVQPLLYNTNETPDLRAKYLYTKLVKNFFTNSQLHQSTRTYLFGKSSRETWKLVGNKKIKWHHDLLDTLTTLLKPLIVVAIGWAIIKFMIEKNLAYDELKITLGFIQEKIAYLKKLAFAKVILEYKNTFVVLLVILFIVLTRVKDQENRTKAFKKTISFIIGIVSVLGGLTFFGADLGSLVKTKEKKLKELDLQIRTIHENIYVGLAETVIMNDFIEVVTEDATNYLNEKIRLDSLFNTFAYNIKHPEAKELLNHNLQTHNRKFLDSTDFNLIPLITEVVEGKSLTTFPYSNFMANYYHDQFNMPEIEEFSNRDFTKTYWANPNEWNTENGLFYEKKAANLKTEFMSIKLQPSEKIILAAKQILDAFSKELINAVVGIFNIENVSIPKAFFSFITAEKLKTCLAPKLANLIVHLGNVKGELVKMMKPCCFKITGSSEERIKKIKVENNELLKNEIAWALIKQKELIATEKKEQLEREVAKEREKLAKKAEIKLRERVEKTIAVDESLRNDELYQRAIDDIVDLYKKEINFDNLDRVNLDEVVRSPKLDRQIFKNALGATTVRHPGPRITCPICNAIKLLKF